MLTLASTLLTVAWVINVVWWAFQVQCWALSFEHHCRMTHCLWWTHKRLGSHFMWTTSEEGAASQGSTHVTRQQLLPVDCILTRFIKHSVGLCKTSPTSKMLDGGEKMTISCGGCKTHCTYFFITTLSKTVLFLFKHRNPKAGWSLEQMEWKSACPLLLTG